MNPTPHAFPVVPPATARRASARRPRFAVWPLLAVALVGAFVALAGTARAGENGSVQFKEADYAAYAKLRLAKAVADEKRMFAHDKAKQAAIDAEFARACADAGWTRARFETVDEEVDWALSAINDPENAGEDVSPTTLATVKAHLSDLNDLDGLQSRARELVQAEAQAARRGAAPTPAQLAGRWVWDAELTIASMAEGLGDDLRQSMRDQLSKTLVAASYTFGPGDVIVAVNQRPGAAPQTDEGHYRLEGSKLVILARVGSRDRMQTVDIGLKDGHLLIGMMGMYSVFRRE